MTEIHLPMHGPSEAALFTEEIGNDENKRVERRALARLSVEIRTNMSKKAMWLEG